MRRYSETVMEHFQSPTNFHVMDDADAVGLVGIPGQGRHLVLYLKIGEGRVRDASFQCHGCGATVASGSMLVEMIVDHTIDECRQITHSQLDKKLGGLPADKRHCAGYAVRALNQALEEWSGRQADS